MTESSFLCHLAHSESELMNAPRAPWHTVHVSAGTLCTAPVTAVCRDDFLFFTHFPPKRTSQRKTEPWLQCNRERRWERKGFKRVPGPVRGSELGFLAVQALYLAPFLEVTRNGGVNWTELNRGQVDSWMWIPTPPTVGGPCHNQFTGVARKRFCKKPNTVLNCESSDYFSFCCCLMIFFVCVWPNWFLI